MHNPFITFLELMFPFMIGIFLLISIRFLKKEGESKVTFSFFNLSYQIPIKNLFVTRVVLLLIVFTLFCIPAFKNYSRFFSSHYEMEVFFDNEGIKNSLKEFSDKEIISFNISKNWEDKKSQYFRKINGDIFKMLGIRDFFDQKYGSMYSIGETSFIVEKIKGWQKYYIREASGFLTHYLERPNESRRQFNSKFELLNTKDNYINAGIFDIYFRHTKILRPHFKQIANLTLTGEKVIYYCLLITVTKIKFFPIIKISNTIYFVRSEDRFHLIPIGYAVYRPM